MKKCLMILALALASVKGFSQTTNDTITLYQMNKVQLAKIYLQEANRVTKKNTINCV